MTQSEINDARPTVYMLVEIKVREFRAKLHVALQLAERGFRVYLGTRGAVSRALEDRPHPAGVYYFKGGERAGTLEAIRGACEFVVGQDEEVGPALSPRDIAHAWRTRVTPSMAELIDEMYVYAAGHQRVLHEVHPPLAERSVVTGWPRADLWSASLRQPDEQRADRIRSSHGQFVLFVSNFKVTSSEQRDRVVSAARQRHEQLAHEPDATNGVPDPSPDKEFGTKASARLAAFSRTVEVLRQVAARTDVPIIVRPHPAEDPVTWRRALRAVEGIEVVYEGEVGPWILASSAMLHTGCTTAVQAAHYQANCGELVVGKFSAHEEPSVPSLVSHTLGSVEDVVAFVEASTGAGNADRWSRPKDVDDSEWFGATDGRAAHRIADRMSRLDVTPEPPLRAWRRVPAQRVAAKVIGRTRRWLKAVTRSSRFVGTNAQDKVPGGIHLDEVRRLVDTLGGPSVSIREPRFDLVEIVATNGNTQSLASDDA